MTPFEFPTCFDDLVRLRMEEEDRERAAAELRKFEAELRLGRKLKPYEEYERLMLRTKR